MNEASHPGPATLGQLRASGYRPRGTKEELRNNLLDRLRSGATAFPGIVGFDDTVLPELEGAICWPATTWCCSASAARARPG